MRIKNFIQNCKTLSCPKEEIVSKAENPLAKEMLNEFLFELEMPWLVKRTCFIAESDVSYLVAFEPKTTRPEKAIQEFLEIIKAYTVVDEII